MKIMSFKIRWIVATCLALLFGVVTFSFISFEVASASTTVTYDYHVVAGHGTSPTPPYPAPSPSGFNFTVDPPVFNFGNVTYREGREYLYTGFTDSPDLPNGAYARVNITNLVGYDITILELTAEVTGGTPTEPFWFSPAKMWFGDWTVVWFDPLDPYYPVFPQDEVDYHTGEVRVLRDDDWLTKAVNEPCDAPTGPSSLLQNDSSGDAGVTGHVKPVALANGATFTEYFGIILFGDVELGTEIDGTITLTLTYEPFASASEFPWLFVVVAVVIVLVVVATVALLFRRKK